MLFWAVVSDARHFYWCNERKRGRLTAARIAVTMIKRDRAVRSAVYNQKTNSITVVLRSGFSGEVFLRCKDWGACC